MIVFTVHHIQNDCYIWAWRHNLWTWLWRNLQSCFPCQTPCRSGQWRYHPESTEVQQVVGCPYRWSHLDRWSDPSPWPMYKDITFMHQYHCSWALSQGFFFFLFSSINYLRLWSTSLLCGPLIALAISYPFYTYQSHEMKTTTWQKTIVFNLINNARMVFSSNFDSLLTKFHLIPSKKWAFTNGNIHFCNWSHDRKWCHYLQIINHIIIILKWRLKFQICARHVHW